MAGAMVTRKSGQSVWIGDVLVRVFLRGKQVTLTIEREGGLPELRTDHPKIGETRKC